MEEPIQTLSDDVELLKKIVREQGTTIEQLTQALDANKRYTEHLEESLLLARQHRFGRRSEKDQNQSELALFDDPDLLAIEPPPEDPPVEVAAHQRHRKPARELPNDLPRVIVEHDLPIDQQHCDCGDLMQRISSTTSEQLAVVPEQFFVIVHRRFTYACGKKQCIKTAPMPPQPLPASQASPQLLAHAIVSKFHDGLPLYRQEKIAARQGVELPRDKLARWLVKLLPLLQPLHNLCQDVTFSYDITQIDATGIQVLKEDGRRAETKSYLWIRRGGPPDKPVVVVDYSTSACGETVFELLNDTHGYLVCDASTSFNLSVRRQALSLVYCNDHARRRFAEVLKVVGDKKKTKDWAATKAIGFYKALYHIEQEIKDLLPQQKFRERQARAVPLWDEFLKWAEAEYAAGIAHRRTREAFAYLIKHAEGLRRYCDDGRLPISNIRTEHVAKTIAVPRKNFLFADTVDGAKISAMLYGLLESAKASDHNAFHYMSVILDALPRAECLADFEALSTLR